MLRVFDKILGLVQSPKASSEDLATEIITRSVPRDKETGSPIVLPDREFVLPLIKSYAEGILSQIEIPSILNDIPTDKDIQYKEMIVDAYANRICTIYYSNRRDWGSSSLYKLTTKPQYVSALRESYVRIYENLYFEKSTTDLGVEQ